MIYSNINSEDDPNVTLLMLAVAERDFTRVKFLIESNVVNVNARGKSGYTPLMVAAMYGRCSIGEYLLKQGVNPNAWNKDGETAFNIAVTKEDSEFAVLLYKNGAARSVMDRHGIVPFAQRADDGNSVTFGLVQSTGNTGRMLYKKQVPLTLEGCVAVAENECRRLSQNGTTPETLVKRPLFRCGNRKRKRHNDDTGQLTFDFFSWS